LTYAFNRNIFERMKRATLPNAKRRFRPGKPIKRPVKRLSANQQSALRRSHEEFIHGQLKAAVAEVIKQQHKLTLALQQMRAFLDILSGDSTRLGPA
jgi:hypothetical protein